MWAEFSSSAPYFLHMGLSKSPIMYRCLLSVLCPAWGPVTTLDCMLLKDSSLDLAAGIGMDINPWSWLWVLVRIWHNIMCWLTSQHLTFSFILCLDIPKACSSPTKWWTEPSLASSLPRLNQILKMLSFCTHSWHFYTSLHTQCGKFFAGNKVNMKLGPPVFCATYVGHFWSGCTSLASISSKFSHVGILHVKFWHTNFPVCLTLFMLKYTLKYSSYFPSRITCHNNQTFCFWWFT
jgi:hypothetical protein